MEKEKLNTPGQCPGCPVSRCEWEFAMSGRKVGSSMQEAIRREVEGIGLLSLDRKNTLQER